MFGVIMLLKDSPSLNLLAETTRLCTTIFWHEVEWHDDHLYKEPVER